MNLSKIKTILESTVLTDELKESLIFRIISEDKKAIPSVLSILNEERERNEAILSDSNAELSRALVGFMDLDKPKKDRFTTKEWIVDNIKKHYLKWSSFIKCNFKIDGLP